MKNNRGKIGHPCRASGKKFRLGYCTTEKIPPKAELFFDVRVVVVCERDSHVRVVCNRCCMRPLLPPYFLRNGTFSTASPILAMAQAAPKNMGIDAPACKCTARVGCDLNLQIFEK